MPNRDKTGPEGKGSRIGRGLGDCPSEDNKIGRGIGPCGRGLAFRRGRR